MATASRSEAPVNGAKPPEKDPFANVDVQIKRSGKEMILPDDPEQMSYKQAITLLKRKDEEERTVIAVSEIVEAFPWDGAIAFMKAMKETYGWAQAVPQMTWFGPIPPKFMTVQTGPEPEDTVQVIWGEFSIPGLKDAELRCGTAVVNNRLVFQITGQCLKMHHRQVKALGDLTRKIVREESLYRGKAFSMKVANNGKIDFNIQPEFIATKGINENELIFPKVVQERINTNVWAPIVNTETCRKHKVPLKRGVLLEGPFGVGKTLLATVTAKLCQEHGWTFIMIDKVQALEVALDFAKLYSPAVVFAEDIDRAIAGQERTTEIDAILNTIDGVKGKTTEVITILTTNDVKKINQAMLRPGRLDAVISISAPDAEAAQKLMRVYARGLIDENESLEEAGKAVAGQIPAVIREVVERSKLSAIFRTPKGKDFKLTDDDLRIAAVDMKAHLELLNAPRDRKLTASERVGEGMKALIEEVTAPRKVEADTALMLKNLPAMAQALRLTWQTE